MRRKNITVQAVNKEEIPIFLFLHINFFSLLSRKNIYFIFTSLNISFVILYDDRTDLSFLP